jgi:peptidoglycan/LPS O-acetylase OafA/YrhL
MQNKFIPGLNGLRAIAIIAVIAYHSKIQHLGSYIFEGGFFGVDIFFIISGYLMTILIINEYKINKIFLWKKFIIKRIKRIVPSLIFWIIIALIFGYFFFLPRYNIDLGKSALSSLIFVSNIYYYLNDTIYSDIANLHKSLLHTWSLSLEMQFYLIFPFLILFFYKNFKNNILVINFIIILLSFLLSTILFYFDRSFTFYNLPARLWQFFLGSTIYFLKKDNILSNNIFSYIGFSLILLAVFLFENNNSHLVFISILPSIGSFLLINNLNKNNFINKFLSFKIIIFIGTISYSLYLVHYIVMSFFRVSLIADNNITNKLIIFILIIVLSISSYYLIEKPFKKIDYRKITNKLFSFVAIILAISLGVLLIQNSIKDTSTDMFLKNSIIKPWETLKYNNEVCFNKKDNFCHFKYKNNNKEVILLGDSTLASIQSDLLNQLSKSNFNILTITQSNCFFFYNASQYKKNNEKTLCDINYQKQISNIIDNTKNAVVIVYLNYNTILKEFKYKKSDKENIEFMSENEINKNLIESLEKILQNNKIILIYPTQVLKFEVDRKLYSKLSRNKEKRNDFLKNADNWITYTEKEYFLQNKKTIKLLNSINNKNLLRVFPNTIFCKMGKCLIHDEKDIYYYDQIHLAKKGSSLISNQVIKVIKDNNL